jgi:hypothetical protein
MDAKRAVGGFCTFVGGTFVSIIQATQPSWFGNHAWILPASSVVLFVGLLVWLCQYRWAQKLLGIVQPQPPPNPISPQAQTEHNLSSLIPDGRLKIISAHYGVDGGPNADVAEGYLRPKVCGHSLAGWVGADLFGGFQPIIGLTKRVKVHYSFDGTEGTISKKEHELLVLPDPSLVEVPRIVVTGLEESDPRIMPSFVDGRKHPIPSFVSFELKNRGGRDALWVRLNPIKLQKRIVFFDVVAESIAPTDFRNFYANVENQSGIDANRDLIKAMNEEWASRANRDTLREIAFPARIDYEDSEGTRFECDFTLIYHGGRGYNQPVDFKCIECRDIYWRRIPKFVKAN